jgi:hypothetical protein
VNSRSSWAAERNPVSKKKKIGKMHDIYMKKVLKVFCAGLGKSAEKFCFLQCSGT